MSTTISASQMMMQMGQMKNQLISEQMIQANSSNGLGQHELKLGQESVNFSDLLGSAIKQVNNVQQHAGELKKDFEMGKEGIDLVQVMVANEKSSVAFAALLETRNKLLRAYTQVLNTRV